MTDTETNSHEVEVLPYVSTWSHELVGDVVLLADGSYGAAWEITPFDLLTFDEKNILDLEGHIYGLLASLPYGSYMLNNDADHNQAGAYYQIINFRNSDFDRDFDRIDSVTKGRSGISADAVSEHNNHLRNQSRRGSFIKRKPILFVRYYPEQATAASSASIFKFLSYSIKPSAVAELVTGRRIKQLSNDLANIESVMLGGSLSPKRLNEQALRRVLYDYLNPLSGGAGVPLDPAFTLRSQVMPDFTPGHFMFELDGMWHAVLSMRTLPSVISSCSGAMFKSFEGDVVMNFTIYPQHLAEKRIAVKKRSMKMGFTEPNIQKGKRDIAAAEEHLKNGSTYGVGSTHVVLRHTDPEILRLKIRNTMSEFSRIDGIEGKPERKSAPAIFFSACVPFACGPSFEKLSHRARLQELPWLANLAPIFGGYSGTATRPVFTAPTLDNPQSIFTFDPFDESQLNWNAMLIGKSGSGKSTLVIRLMSSFTLYEPLLFLIEKGSDGKSSYKRFTELHGGQHFTVSTVTPLCINVFDSRHIDRNKSSELGALVSGALSFCEALASDMSTAEYSQLSLFVRKLFEEHEVFYMTNLVDALLDGDEDAQSLAKKLQLFTKQGAYGAFVDGDTSISLDTDISSFDLDGIYDERRLMPAYFMAIDMLIQRKVKENPTKKHLTLYDEVWKPLEYESVRKMLLNKNRTIRKQGAGGAVYYVDQLVSTFESFDETRKILQQTTNWFLLEMERADIPSLHAAGFTEEEMKIAGELKTEPGKLSTAYARHIDKGMPRGAVIISDVTPLNYSIMTNDGDDGIVFEALKSEMAAKGESHADTDVVRAFALLLPKGIRPILGLVREEQERDRSVPILKAIRSIQSRGY